MLREVREEHSYKHFSPKLVTEDGKVTDVREEHLPKHIHFKLVTLYETPLYVILSGIATSVAEPLYFASSAVLVSVSKLYLNPSSEVYSMTSAFNVMLIAANRAMSMNLKVKSFFIVRCVFCQRLPLDGQ